MEIIAGRSDVRIDTTVQKALTGKTEVLFIHEIWFIRDLHTKERTLSAIYVVLNWSQL
jgi:hypothetical protein